MHCPKCNAPLALDAEFCSKCGAKIGQTTVNPKAGQQVSNQAVMVMVGCLVVLGVVLWQAGFLGKSSSTRDDTPAVIPVAPATDAVEVTYRVFGSGTTEADLTFENAQGGTEQRSSQDIEPVWETTFKAKSGQFVYLSAQNKNDAGSVTCEIRVDGGAFKHSVSDGAYAIATCNGLVP